MKVCDIEVVQQTRMELLVFLRVEVIYHVREAECSDECLLVSRRVCAVPDVILLEDLTIVIDREIQVLVSQDLHTDLSLSRVKDQYMVAV